MREIKFRVYLDKMYYQNEYVEYDTNLAGIDFLNKTVTFAAYTDGEEADNLQKYSFDENDILYKKDLKIMQYTGLKDEYGDEIYEGDILFESFGERYYKVVFENGSFRAEFEGDFEEYSFDLIDVVAQGYEVVGNIYENPELIIGGSK
jgi:phage protein